MNKICQSEQFEMTTLHLTYYLNIQQVTRQHVSLAVNVVRSNNCQAVQTLEKHTQTEG